MTLREYKTSTEKIVLLGKTAESNEELIKQLSNSEIVLHTKEPGSPFANIKSDKKDVSKEEIYEAAIMCAKHSQDWRDNKRDIEVSVFLSDDIYKDKQMKVGTFGVKRDKKILVKKKDILNFEKTILK